MVAEVEREHEQVTVTRNGVAAAVVSVEECEGLQETIAVLTDAGAIADLREAGESVAAGELYSTGRSARRNAYQ